MTRKLIVTSAIAATFLGLIGWIAPPTASWPLEPGAVYEVAVDGDSAQFELAFDNPRQAYLLVVTNLAQDVQPVPVVMRCEPIERLSSSGLIRAPRPSWEEVARLAPPRVVPSHESMPPDSRRFWLRVGPGASENPAAFRELHAQRKLVGERAAIYVDDSDHVPEETIAAIVRAFDTKVYPRLTPWTGAAADVDRDGRLAIVLTSWLDRLDGGQLSLGGMVSAGDFNPQGKPPYSNRADVLYLNANVRPGPHLETLLAHEYTHAVVCSVRRDNDSLLYPWLREESWLNESLAHLAESLQDNGWSNLDHRIAARLNSPCGGPLAIPSRLSAVLGREPAVRGSGYLFLRWCAARFGPGIISRLIHSPRSGIQNLESVTGVPFAQLYRQYSIDLFHGDWESAGDTDRLGSPLAMPDLWGKTGRHWLAGVAHRDWSLDGAAMLEPQHVPGTSSCYVVMRASQPCLRRVALQLGSPGRWQVSLVPLNEVRPRLEVTSASQITADSAAVPDLPNRQAFEIHNRGNEPARLVHIAWGTDHSPANEGQSLEDLELLPGESTIVHVPMSLPATANRRWLHISARDPSGVPAGFWRDLW